MRCLTFLGADGLNRVSLTSLLSSCYCFLFNIFDIRLLRVSVVSSPLSPEHGQGNERREGRELQNVPDDSENKITQTNPGMWSNGLEGYLNQLSPAPKHLRQE